MGKADPYVMVMWEGVEFVAQNLGFRDKLRKYYNGQFWPRTKWIGRELNPVWNDEEITIEAESPTICQGAFLHVLVVDHEKVGSDHFMCATTMSLWDLCKGGSQIHEIDRPMTQEGKVAGRIKFKLDVSFPKDTTPS